MLSDVKCICLVRNSKSILEESNLAGRAVYWQEYNNYTIDDTGVYCDVQYITIYWDTVSKAIYCDCLNQILQITMIIVILIYSSPQQGWVEFDTASRGVYWQELGDTIWSVSQYRGYDSVYCDILGYCKQDDILGYLFLQSLQWDFKTEYSTSIYCKPLSDTNL